MFFFRLLKDFNLIQIDSFKNSCMHIPYNSARWLLVGMNKTLSYNVQSRFSAYLTHNFIFLFAFPHLLSVLKKNGKEGSILPILKIRGVFLG